MFDAIKLVTRIGFDSRHVGGAVLRIPEDVSLPIAEGWVARRLAEPISRVQPEHVAPASVPPSAPLPVEVSPISAPAKSVTTSTKPPLAKELFRKGGKS